MSSRTSLSNPTAQVVAEHPGLVKLGQVGWAAKGVVYTIAGVLAATVVFGSFGWSTPGSNEEASPNGAIKTIAGSPGGALLLWVLGLSMLLYAAWRVTSAVFPGGHDAEASAKRIGYVVSAVIYTTFAITAITLARAGAADSAQGADGNSKVTNLTGRVMSYGIGRWLIGLIGVIVIAAGIYRLVKGLKQDVEDELDLSGMSPDRVLWTRRLGAIGEVGRGIAIGVIGFFLSAPPSTSTPTKRRVSTVRCDGWRWRRGGCSSSPSSRIGFVAYGVFCLATFTHRRFQGP